MNFTILELVLLGANIALTLLYFMAQREILKNKLHAVNMIFGIAKGKIKVAVDADGNLDIKTIGGAS